jgi:hypothetical protein
MLDHWVKIFTKRKNGEIEYSSLVWRLATKLSLMDTALVACIPGERPKITAEHFLQGHMTKEIRDDRSCIMIYRNKNFEILLPNLGLRLYSTPSLLMVPSTAAAGMRTSERRDQNLPTHYFGANPSPQGAAYMAYQTFVHPGPSRPL